MHDYRKKPLTMQGRDSRNIGWPPIFSVHFATLAYHDFAKENIVPYEVAFLSNVFRVSEKLWAVFNAEKKLFNPAQVALTKIPRNDAKIYHFWRDINFTENCRTLTPYISCKISVSVNPHNTKRWSDSHWSSYSLAYCVRVRENAVLIG